MNVISPRCLLLGAGLTFASCAIGLVAQSARVGDERAVSHHLVNDEELRMTIPSLVAFGKLLFTANWTDQDGAGRPFSKGTGAALSDLRQPLIGVRRMNRVS